MERLGLFCDEGHQLCEYRWDSEHSIKSIKAVPAFERLFEAVVDAHHEAKAKERLEEKLDFINHAIL